MTTKDEALRMALDALCWTFPTGKYTSELEPKCRAAITACREALTQKDEREPLQIPRMPEDISTFLMANYSAATFAKSPDEPDYDNVYEVSVRDLLEAFDNWEAFDCFPPKRKPMTEGEIAECISGIFAERNYWVKFARTIEAHHGIGGEA